MAKAEGKNDGGETVHKGRRMKTSSSDLAGSLLPRCMWHDAL